MRGRGKSFNLTVVDGTAEIWDNAADRQGEGWRGVVSLTGDPRAACRRLIYIGGFFQSVLAQTFQAELPVLVVSPFCFRTSSTTGERGIKRIHFLRGLASSMEKIG